MDNVAKIARADGKSLHGKIYLWNIFSWRLNRLRLGIAMNLTNALGIRIHEILMKWIL